MSMLITSTNSNGVVETKVDSPSELVEEKKPVSAKAEETADESGASEKEETDETVESKDESAVDSEGRPKKKGGIQKKINKLTKRASVAEQEANYWRQEAMRNQAPKAAENVPAPKKTDAADKPKSENFESHDEYIEALTDWKSDQKWNEREAKKKEDDIKASFQKRRESFGEQVKEFVKTHDDYDEVIGELNDIPMSTTVQDIILDTGPELAYALGQDKEEYKRICSLSAVAAARELGKFEANLKTSESPKTPEAKTTKAPPPLKPVGSQSSSVKSIYDTDLSQQEYEQIRVEQIAKRRAAWG